MIDHHTVSFPLLFFNSKTLVVLRLGDKLRIHIPWIVSFPSLKILELSVLHPDLESMQALFYGCRVLEYLNLEAFLGVSKKIEFYIVFFLPTLKRLKMCLREDNAPYCDKKIVIYMRSIENLSIHDDFLVCNLRGEMPPLAKASVSVGQSWIQDENSHHADCIHDIFKRLAKPM